MNGHRCLTAMGPSRNVPATRCLRGKSLHLLTQSRNSCLYFPYSSQSSAPALLSLEMHASLCSSRVYTFTNAQFGGDFGFRPQLLSEEQETPKEKAPIGELFETVVVGLWSFNKFVT